jgi:hypothetical protein
MTRNERLIHPDSTTTDSIAGTKNKNTYAVISFPFNVSLYPLTTSYPLFVIFFTLSGIPYPVPDKGQG